MLLTILLLGLLSSLPALAASEGTGADTPVGDPVSSAGSAEETEGGSDTALGVSTGTAVLMGAGVFTYVREKRRENSKKEQEYVHFENHTRPYDPETGKFRNE